MKPTTIKIDGQDVEVVPFGRDAWLCCGTEQDRLTSFYLESGESYYGFTNDWGANDLKYSSEQEFIAIALDHFWPGWRERNPEYTG